jgi:hypothetical protein
LGSSAQEIEVSREHKKGASLHQLLQAAPLCCCGGCDSTPSPLLFFLLLLKDLLLLLSIFSLGILPSTGIRGLVGRQRKLGPSENPDSKQFHCSLRNEEIPF